MIYNHHNWKSTEYAVINLRLRHILYNGPLYVIIFLFLRSMYNIYSIALLCFKVNILDLMLGPHNSKTIMSKKIKAIH